jgi:hypothetical protein
MPALRKQLYPRYTIVRHLFVPAAMWGLLALLRRDGGK